MWCSFEAESLYIKQNKRRTALVVAGVKSKDSLCLLFTASGMNSSQVSNFKVIIGKPSIRERSISEWGFPEQIGLGLDVEAWGGYRSAERNIGSSNEGRNGRRVCRGSRDYTCSKWRATTVQWPEIELKDLQFKMAEIRFDSVIKGNQYKCLSGQVSWQAGLVT